MKPPAWVIEYVDFFKHTFGLNNWEIELFMSDPRLIEGGDARIDVRPHSYYARIDFASTGLYDEPSERARECIIHEMLHLASWVVTTAVETYLNVFIGHRSKEHRDNALYGFYVADEQFTVQVSRGLALAIPYPLPVAPASEGGSDG